MAIVVIAVAFYSGGYVAGRLARFDGARNGFGVWMVAVLVAVLAAGAGALLNSQYDWLTDVQRPDVALSNGTLATGGVIAAVAVIVVTLLAAIVGGKAGQRYHEKIDRLIEAE
jgi:drug/metabolite transporter (DMT)-like permease